MKTRKLSEKEIRETVNGRFTTSRMRGENKSREAIEVEVRSEGIEVAVQESNTTGGVTQVINERYPFVPRQTSAPSQRSVSAAKLAKGLERLGLSSDEAKVAANGPDLNDVKAKRLGEYLGSGPAVAAQFLKIRK